MDAARLDLVAKIAAVRESFRWVGAQYGDDACWLDVEKLFAEVIPEYRTRTNLPDKAGCLAICAWYVDEFSGADGPPPPERDLSDADLATMTIAELDRELDKLVNAARTLASLPVTARDRRAMRALFHALPEGPEPHVRRRLAPREEMLASCDMFFSDPDRLSRLHSW